MKDAERTIGKHDLIDRMKKRGILKKYADIFIDVFVEIIEEALVNNERVKIYGFGTFENKVIPARQVIDILSGERITIGPNYVPTFRPGESFKECVREGFIRGE